MTTSRQSPLATARQRRTKRGAAMTEAAMFIPVFAIVFTGMGYLAHVYTGKLNVMRFSRAYAWQHAVCNCAGTDPSRDPADKTGSGSSKAGTGSGSTVTPADEPIATPNSNQLADASADEHVASLSKDNPELTKSGANTTSASQQTVTYSDATWSPSMKVTSSSKMMCNEPRTKLEVVDIAKRVLGLVTFP